MFDLINFDSWKPYDGASEGSGRSEKIWLISDTGEIGLFKFPKIDPSDQKETTEHISEHLAYQLGKVLNVCTAKVDIGIREGRIGSMSYLVRSSNEVLIEGIDFISGKYPAYNAEKMLDEQSKTYYCIDYLFNTVGNILPYKIWIEMMVFDFLIGNADRHQSNWALLVSIETKEQTSIKIRQCPLYDNGSSLCCYVNGIQVDAYDKDLRRFESLVDSKSKSIIRVDGSKKARPRHREVVEYLLKKYPITRSIVKRFLECLNKDVIDNIMDQYSAEILDPKKNILIRRYLLKKLEILNTLINLEDANNGIAE